MRPTKRAARITGLLYLVVVLSGPFVLLYVPGKLFVPGDAAATAARILAGESLYRAHVIVGVISELFFVASVVALYRLLKGVNAEVAAAMVLAILIQVPVAIAGSANQVAALSLLKGGDLLAGFEPAQRDALALLLLEFDRKGVYVSEVFWGLWLLPLAWLVYRSRFLPRLLGVWLAANGLAYLAIAGTGMLVPEHAKRAMTLATPLLFGEMALMLWLLVVGVRETPASGEAVEDPRPLA